MSSIRRISIVRKHQQLQLLKERVDELSLWLSSVLDGKYSFSDDSTFFTDIETGILLLQLLPKIAPHNNPLRTAKMKIHKRAKAGSFLARDNLSQFLKGCSELGVPPDSLFRPDDLVQRSNLKQVVACLLYLSRIAAIESNILPPDCVEKELRIEHEYRQSIDASDKFGRLKLDQKHMEPISEIPEDDQLRDQPVNEKPVEEVNEKLDIKVEVNTEENDIPQAPDIPRSAKMQEEAIDGTRDRTTTKEIRTNYQDLRKQITMKSKSPIPNVGDSIDIPLSKIKLPSFLQSKDLGRTPVYSIYEQDDESKLTERAKAKRLKVLAEIISSETSYVSTLENIITLFLSPIREHAEGWGIQENEVDAIFSNVEMLYNFHMVLLCDLQEDNSIPSVFLRNAPYLKMYSQYVNDYSKGLSVVNTLQSNRKFSKFLNEAHAHGGMDMMSYLIAPIQRIPRYLLLLKELEKYTPATHEEADELTAAVKLVSQIASHVNENKREVENLSKLLAVQNRIKMHGTVISLFKPGRRLLREGLISMLRGKITTSLRPRIFLLFSDILLWTNPQLQYKDHIHIFQLDAIELEPSRGETAFFISGINGTGESLELHCSCETPEGTKSWIASIHEAVDSFHSNIETFRTAASDIKVTQLSDYQEHDDAHVDPILQSLHPRNYRANQ